MVSARSDGVPAEPIRVVRVISRLNIGGPAIHTVLLTAGLNGHGFESLLVTGTPGDEEGDMSYVARDRGVAPTIIPELGRELSWRDDLTAFLTLVRLFRSFRPHIVHTHTAKAGAVGRLAAAVAGVPIRVHTFHGHVFRGYFSPLKTQAFLWIERALGRLTQAVVAISERQRRDLCEVYRIVPSTRCTVIPLGFDLAPFASCEARRGTLRREMGVEGDVPLVGIVGRLVPIKDHAMFLRAARRVRDTYPSARFVIVGDGELRPALERAVADLGLTECVHFLGWRRDLDAVYADLDVVALTSINEGTPVAVIEAMASGRAVVATDVGGVGDVVAAGRTGLLVPMGDAEACADAVSRLLGDAVLRAEMGRVGRERVLARYGSERLVADVRQLYVGLLAAAGLRVPDTGSAGAS